MDLHQIALYAGHRSLQTTMLYIHLSGVDLTAAVTRSLAGFERWIAMILEEADQ
jgi:integrase/recombinase XerD